MKSKVKLSLRDINLKNMSQIENGFKLNIIEAFGDYSDAALEAKISELKRVWGEEYDDLPKDEVGILNSRDAFQKQADTLEIINQLEECLELPEKDRAEKVNKILKKNDLQK